MVLRLVRKATSLEIVSLRVSYIRHQAVYPIPTVGWR
jgi:hypothetical protein